MPAFVSWCFHEFLRTRKIAIVIITGLYHFYNRNARPFHSYLNLTYFLKQICYTSQNWIFDSFSIYHLNTFQIMKFLSTIFATMTSCLAFESGFQTNQALLINEPLQPSLSVPIRRSKRDLIGFNRQGNNIFSHGRQWNNRMGMLFKRLLKPCNVIELS